MPPQDSASGTPGEVELRPNRLEVDRLLDDPRTRIIVCCGSGGVGKTTTAAAVGLRAAERGRHVVVLTVDPARRLAQSMGLSSLDNTPRLVPGVGPASAPYRQTGQERGRRRRQPARHDARYEADLRRDRGGTCRPGPGGPDPGESLLPVAVIRILRHPGVHGDGEAR